MMNNSPLRADATGPLIRRFLKFLLKQQSCQLLVGVLAAIRLNFDSSTAGQMGYAYR